jgi:type IV secretory pathway TraG/TraD family ATPase VirD4
MTRRATQLRSSADIEVLLGWVIITIIALVTVALCGLWVAGEVSYLTGGTPRPGNPAHYARSLLTHHAAWPDPLGWASLATVVALAIAGVVLAFRVMPVKFTRKHRVDQVARMLAPRTDRTRLGPRARAEQSARLSPGATDWQGSPIGRIIPGRYLARSGPEDVSVDVWGARAGKTTKRVIPAILDAPGPVLATSNKRDIVDATSTHRQTKGTTWVFDPQGMATSGQPAFTYNPLQAVTDVSAAQRLAAIFEASTREPGARTDAHWDTAGRDLLAWLFLAAASDNEPIGTIWEWLANPDDTTAATILRAKGHTGPAAAVEGVLGQPEKMRGSTYGTAQRMARALVNPRFLAWVTPTSNLPEFNPDDFPTSGDTLYALSKEGEGSSGPFVAALTAHVCEAAERHAAAKQTGRLDIPMIVELDEAANIVRWPDLPKLYSHYGSRGILLHTYLQSWTQGAEAWGEYGIRALWSAATIRVLGAGVADQRFLEEFSALIGDHDEWILQSVQNGRGLGDRQATRSVRKERTLAASDLASLPKDRAIVLAAGGRPVVVETKAWNRS